MAEMMFWGFVVRFITSLVQASPFILAGFAVAAVLRRFFGSEDTRRLFGEGTRSSLLRAWVIGMLLPVCSPGAIPVIREMRRAGISGGTIPAFAMSGPLFNPLSLLYGLTLSEPIAIISFAACSLVIVTVVGLIWDRLYPNSALPVSEVKAVAYGYRRMLAVGTAAGREAASGSFVYILVGLMGTGLLGAAFVLLVLGAGMNIGLLAWLYREYGFKRGRAWMVRLLTVMLALAYGVDKPLFPKDIEPANHTHAFDIYCQPFSGTQSTSYFEATKLKLQRDINPFELRPLWISGLLIFSGLVLKIADRTSKLEQWLETAPPGQIAGCVDTIVPGPVLGLLSLAGLVALSIVGCFAYCPAPVECLEAMTDTRIGALSAALSMDHTETKYWAERYDDWTRKLEVGAYLRHGELSDYHRWKARLLREQLQILEHEVEDGERDQVTKLVGKISRSHNRLRRAFAEEL